MRKPTPKPAPPVAPKRPPRKGEGAPPHEPDEKGRRRVTAWAGGGIAHQDIARSLRIAPGTLRKHYRVELDTGKAMMDGLAISALGAAMQKGGHDAVMAAKWWTATRMGWSEKVRAVGPDGESNPVVEVIYRWADAEAKPS